MLPEPAPRAAGRSARKTEDSTTNSADREQRGQVGHDRVAVARAGTARSSPAGRRSARTSAPPRRATPRRAGRSARSAACGRGSGSARSPRRRRCRRPRWPRARSAPRSASAGSNGACPDRRTGSSSRRRRRRASASAKTLTTGIDDQHADHEQRGHGQAPAHPGRVLLGLPDARAAAAGAGRLRRSSGIGPLAPALQEVDQHQHRERDDQQHDRDRGRLAVGELLEPRHDQDRARSPSCRACCPETKTTEPYSPSERANASAKPVISAGIERGQDHARGRSASASPPARRTPPRPPDRGPRAPAARCAPRTAGRRRSAPARWRGGCRRPGCPSGTRYCPSQPFFT